MSLTFSKLDDSRIEEAFLVLVQVGDWIREQGRRQRISKTTLETYQAWQTESANFVVTESESIVGLVSVIREPIHEWTDFISIGEVPLIRGLATRPSHRGKSVGSFALKNAIEVCKNDEAIYLDCVSGFLPEYYARFGFKPIAQQVRTYSDELEPYDITLMRLDLGVANTATKV